MSKLVIVDGRNMAYRCFYAFKDLTTSSGRPTAVTYGSALALNRILSEHKPDYMVVVDDSPGQTFRHRLYPEYKGTRPTEGLEGLHAQLPDLYRLVSAYSLPLLRNHGVEADDLIGSLVTDYKNICVPNTQHEVLIVSNDKDFMQLVDERGDVKVRMLRPLRGGGFEIVGVAGVLEKFGVAPSQVIDVLALMGDASDNVPGVFGIGEKGASALVKSCGTLERVYGSLGALKPAMAKKLTLGKSSAFMSRELVTIKTDIQLGFNWCSAMVLPDALERLELLDLFREWEFKSFFEPDSVVESRKNS